MLPAMELAEEPEKPPGGRSKDPNTYKVLSLVRAGAVRADGAGAARRGSVGSGAAGAGVPHVPRLRDMGHQPLAGPYKPLGAVAKG